MKSFQYSMENVLEHRRDKEEDQKQQFARIQKEYIQEKTRLNELQRKLESTFATTLEDRQISTVQRKNLQQYVYFLREKIERQSQLIQDIKGKLESERKKLMFAQRDRKVMEKLKEKAFEQYKEEQNRVEQNTLDELALYAHMRR